MAGRAAGRPGSSKAGAGHASDRRRDGNGHGRMVWDLPSPSAAEVEALSLRFPEVVTIPVETLLPEVEAWSASAVVVRSLGRRVSVDTMARDFRGRAGLKGEVHGYYLDDGVSVLRFDVAEERDVVLGRPWVVAGQALAVEAWRSGFFPLEGAIKTALVWVRLPQLPVEFWREETLREVLRPAGEFISADEWTATRKRLGFARACIRIDLSRPLRPGVLLQGLDDPFWQRFVFECLDGVCLGCGRFHASKQCSAGGGAGSGCGLSAENLAQAAGGSGCQTEGCSSLGPWVLAVRRWQPEPRVEPVVSAAGRGPAGATGGVKGPPVVAAGGSSAVQRRPGKEVISAAGAVGSVSGPGLGGWSKPAKIARRRSPLRRVAGGGDGWRASRCGGGGGWIQICWPRLQCACGRSFRAGRGSCRG